jgi:hypothetical protein
LIFLARHTLQRPNAKNSKQIFPGKELRGYSPIPTSCFCERFNNIPLIGLPFLLQEIGKIGGPNDIIDRSRGFTGRKIDFFSYCDGVRLE